MTDQQQLDALLATHGEAPAGLLQAAQLLTTANEVGKALGWRRPTPEEDETMSAAADACLRASASKTSIIPGML